RSTWPPRSGPPASGSTGPRVRSGTAPTAGTAPECRARTAPWPALPPTSRWTPRERCWPRGGTGEPPHRHRDRVERGGAAARLPRERDVGRRDRGGRCGVRRQDGADRARVHRQGVGAGVAGLRGPEELRPRAGTGEWILSLDADERVTLELRERIRAVLKEDGPADGY